MIKMSALFLVLSWLQAGDLVAGFTFCPTGDYANAMLDTSEPQLRRKIGRDARSVRKGDCFDNHEWGRKHHVVMSQDVLDLLTDNPLRASIKRIMIDPSKSYDDEKHAFSYEDIAEILFNTNTRVYEEQGNPGEYCSKYLKFILAGTLHPEDGTDPICGYAVLVFRRNKVFWDLMHCCFQEESFEDIILPSPIGRHSRPVTARASIAFGPLKFFDITPVDSSGDAQRDQDDADAPSSQGSASQSSKASKEKKRSGRRRYNTKKKAKRLFREQGLGRNANIEGMFEKLEL